MEESLKHLLQGIEQTSHQVTARVRDVVRVGSFEALIDPSTDMTWLNYAVPIAPLGTKADVAESLGELRQVFATRQRTLRFEFTESLWPILPEALEQAGLQLEARQPMMLCTPSDFQPRQVSGVEVRLLAAADESKDLAAYLVLASLGFGMDDAVKPSIEEIDKLREDIRKGRLCCAIADLDSTGAGVGCIIGLKEIGELAGVTTLSPWRRRGVASTLSSFLVQNHFHSGGELVWLSAGDAIAQATYARIGFRLVDSRLNYIDATAIDSN